MEREKHGDIGKFICNVIVVSLFAARLDSGYLFWWCVRGAGAGSCCITTWEAEVERTRMVPALSLVGWWVGGLVAWWLGGLVAWWLGGLVGWWVGGLVGWWVGGLRGCWVDDLVGYCVCVLVCVGGSVG